MDTTKQIIHGHIVHARIKKYEQEKKTVLTKQQEESPYTIELRTGVILKPHSRARFSELCHKKYNQIKKALVCLEGRTMVIIGK